MEALESAQEGPIRDATKPIFPSIRSRDTEIKPGSYDISQLVEALEADLDLDKAPKIAIDVGESIYYHRSSAPTASSMKELIYFQALKLKPRARSLFLHPRHLPISIYTHSLYSALLFLPSRCSPIGDNLTSQIQSTGHSVDLGTPSATLSTR